MKSRLQSPRLTRREMVSARYALCEYLGRRAKDSPDPGQMLLSNADLLRVIVTFDEALEGR